MIEKLELIKAFNCSDTLQAKMQHHIYHNDCINKLNELVDAVNRLQKDYDNVCIWVGEQKLNYNPDTTKGLSTLVEEPEPDGDDAIQEVVHADPFAEQKKWIGKLCRFYDDDAVITSNDLDFGILTSIDKGRKYQYCCNESYNFKHCEPVNPDDDIIYKKD